MSAPSRRAVAQWTCRTLVDRTRPPTTLSFQQSATPLSRPQGQHHLQQHQLRFASSDDKPISSNPILDQYLAKKSQEQAGLPPVSLSDNTDAPTDGDIDQSSIFSDAARSNEQQRWGKMREEEETVEKDAGVMDARGQGRTAWDPEIAAAVLDPKPEQTQKFLRKKRVEVVLRRGRITREELLKRTEREHLLRSHNFKTSTKKLGMLARQIAGKRLDDAIAQMRFSKKKVAQEVLKQLELARDEAVVMRGMGLGNVSAAAADGEEEGLLAADEASPPALPKPAFKPIDIQLKSGSRLRVTDPTQIYIDQAWVGRGPYGSLPDYRARGRMFIMRTPWTSITVVLKEEKTLVREWQERVAKEKKKRTGTKVYQALPDRPITNHRAWYSW